MSLFHWKASTRYILCGYPRVFENTWTITRPSSHLKLFPHPNMRGSDSGHNKSRNRVMKVEINEK